jgi:hypothetical protein
MSPRNYFVTVTNKREMAICRSYSMEIIIDDPSNSPVKLEADKIHLSKLTQIINLSNRIDNSTLYDMFKSAQCQQFSLSYIEYIIMGRASVVVDKDTLQQLINDYESRNTYKNQSHLFKDIALAYGGTIGRSLSPAWVLVKVQELGLQVKTEKGRKGKIKGEGPPVGVRRSRGDKLTGHSSLKLLRQEMLHDQRAHKYLPLLTRVEKGSLKSAIKLNCIYCSNWQPNEVRHCKCETCPMHCIRPFQTSTEDSDESVQSGT